MNAPLPISFKEDLSIWEKTLENYCQENALLKYRLSEIVDNNEDKYFLQTAEYFQNKLLLKDEKLKNLLRQLNEILGNSATLKSEEVLKSQFDALRNEISIFEKRYEALSKEFNEKLLQSH